MNQEVPSRRVHTRERARRRVSIVGATGRMGRLTQAVIAQDHGLTPHRLLGSSSRVEDLDDTDLVVDFTHLAVSRRVVSRCLTRGIPVLVGTSGWTEDDLRELASQQTSASRPTVCVVPNFSVGVVVLSRLAATAAHFYDAAEIVETHDISKVDAPSGTAIRTAEMISARREAGVTAVDAPARGFRVGHVPVHSIRLPGGPDAQTVHLASAYESAEIAYRTTSVLAYRSGLRRAIHAVTPGMGFRMGLEEIVDLDAVFSIR